MPLATSGSVTQDYNVKLWALDARLSILHEIIDFLLEYILLLNHAGKCLSWLIWVNPSQTLNIDICLQPKSAQILRAPLTITYHQWMKTELQVPCIEEIRRYYQTSRHAGTCSETLRMPRARGAHRRWKTSSFPPVKRRQKTQKLAPNCFYWFVYRYSNTGNFQVRRTARFFQMNLLGFRFTAPIKITVVYGCSSTQYGIL